MDQLPPLPPGWCYQHNDAKGICARLINGRASLWFDNAQDAANAAEQLAEAIAEGLISARLPAASDRPSQADMFAQVAPAQLAEDRRHACPTHGRFYQPHCWHCKRRRPDRAHRRARQS